MNRIAYKLLTQWKADPSRKPLVVQGARQVGKTYLIHEFGTKEYSRYAYFNFEETPALVSLFENELTPSKILESLSAYQGWTILPGSTLLFLDEIQVCPRALTSLKYFCEQAPEIHLVAAGSLLGVSVGKTSAFPVGKVNFLNMYPLSFFEFMQALKEDALLESLQKNESWAPLPELLHGKLSGLLKLYLYLGGMPEVVQSYITAKDHSVARVIQKEILQAYARDFSKYTTPTQAIRVSEVWRSLPAHLARENKKFKYSEIRKGGRAVQFESAVEWLRSAGLLYLSMNVTAAKLPLSGYHEQGRFKAYVLDCGLLGAMIDIPSKMIVLGDQLFSEYNGAFVENFVAAEIARKSEGHLYYWISENIAEVDFLIVSENRILPLEAKSGLNRNIKSLRVFAEKQGASRLYRVSPRNFERRDDFANIPLYAIGLFPELEKPEKASSI